MAIAHSHPPLVKIPPKCKKSFNISPLDQARRKKKD